MPAEDPFKYHQRSTSSPAIDAFAVTPNDGADLTIAARALYVGGAGDLNVVTLGGTTVLFSGVSGGAVLPCGVSRVLATDTTATGIVGLV
ncbi:spike base protein, RCAP_Rcc01079 family [Acuticoccus kandeliae]|uniref:spike base protein, RCAP_Rcc01079 family n=1 Tax=Acuticoccus kandeliae TaxID=2073160 RepID=UPI000D3E4CF7|nr:hypothetical protein [Acuticoccus kandeliae]